MKTEHLNSEAIGSEYSTAEENEFFESEYDDDDEGYESFAEYDDDDEGAETAEYDDDDDESADSEFLLGAAAPLLGAAAPLLGGLATSIAPSLIKGVTSIFKPQKRRTRRYSKFAPPSMHGRGVRGVRVRTPRGSAFLKLPTSVVPMRAFRGEQKKTQARANRLTTRINRTQKDLTRTDKKAAQALADARNAILSISRHSKKTKRELRELKEKQKSSATMNLLLSMMQMQGISSRLNDHTHGGGAAVDDGDSDNNMMMMLPLLLMDDGGGDDNSMVMMLMMMMMGNFNK